MVVVVALRKQESEWQWHQLGHMQVCISLHTDNHASTPPLKFFTGRMPFLPPNQQHQSTEGKKVIKWVLLFSSISTMKYRSSVIPAADIRRDHDLCTA